MIPFAAALFLVIADVKSQDIQDGNFPSPDKRFVFKIQNDGAHFVILDKKTGRLSDSAHDLSDVPSKPDQKFDDLILVPLQNFEWFGDSKTLLVIGHVERGSEAECLHFEGKKWVFQDLAPRLDESSDRTFYDVDDVKVGPHSVRLTYEINRQNRQTGERATRYYTFAYDAQTNLGTKPDTTAWVKVIDKDEEAPASTAVPSVVAPAVSPASPVKPVGSP